MVKGEYRTSVIVDPPNGRMPFTQAGTDLAAWCKLAMPKHSIIQSSGPLRERCMENYGYPPIRARAVLLPRQILQTGDHVVIVSDDTPGPRIIHLTGESRSDVLRSLSPRPLLVVRAEIDEPRTRFVLSCQYAERSISADDYAALSNDPDWELKHLLE